MDSTRREGDAVVRADRAGEAELAEGAFEHRAGAAPLDRAQALAREQISRVLIRARERIAPHAIPGRELPFEIRGPEIVGRFGMRGHDAGMPMRPPAAALL